MVLAVRGLNTGLLPWSKLARRVNTIEWGEAPANKRNKIEHSKIFHLLALLKNRREMHLLLWLSPTFGLPLPSSGREPPPAQTNFIPPKCRPLQSSPGTCPPPNQAGLTVSLMVKHAERRASLEATKWTTKHQVVLSRSFVCLEQHEQEQFSTDFDLKPGRQCDTMHGH